MTRTIPFLILCLQSINWALSADSKYPPLILNRNDSGLFFPRYVKKNDISGDVTFVEPDDNTSSTFSFCLQQKIDSYLVGTLLPKNSKVGKCEYAFEFHREIIQDENEKPIACNVVEHDQHGYEMYRTYYKMYIHGIKYTHTLYEYCFNDKQLITTFAHYELTNPSLLKNAFLIEELSYGAEDKDIRFPGQRTVDKDDMEYPHPYEWDDMRQKDYIISKNYNEAEYAHYTPQRIAIPHFVPFAQWKVTFYQWHNVAPMNYILVPYWKRLVENIKSKLFQKTEPIAVYSGINDTVLQDGVSKTLKNGKTKIPMYWWMILYSNNQEKKRGVAVIMHNYAYELDQNKHSPLCENVCEKAGLEDTIPKFKGDNRAEIYCCEVLKEISMRFHNGEGADELLIFQDEATANN